ncbi:Crp/Fnr family transcriptional regulator [Algoriphagus aestuarii]|nr:Crp/Fnr family transcriptional regulator [Algoriphagus aestuarii]
MNVNLALSTSEIVENQTFPDFKIFRKGDLIFRQGSLSEGFYLLKKGTVKLQRSLPDGTQTIVRIVLEHEIFGDCFPNHEQLHSSSAYVLEEDTLIQKLDKDKLNSPEINQLFTKQLLNINRQMGIRHDRFLSIEAEERIKASLYDLGSRMGKKFGSETLLKINLTHEEIAFLADTSRQMVSKTLSALKKCGLLNYSRNRFLFRDLNQFKPTLS